MDLDDLGQRNIEMLEMEQGNTRKLDEACKTNEELSAKSHKNEKRQTTCNKDI